MPTGKKDSPGMNPNAAPLPGFRAASFNQSFYLILQNTGVAQPAPALNVPRGASVTIRAHNGTTTGNAAIIRLGRHPELLNGIDGDPITPDSDIAWPCDSTGEIWAKGTAGDGNRISIQAGRR
jgi:hypothetical protein